MPPVLFSYFVRVREVPGGQVDQRNQRIVRKRGQVAVAFKAAQLGS